VKQPHDAAAHYVNAANCMRKIDAKQAADHLRSAITLFTNAGHFAVAAKHLQDAAEMYEAEAQPDLAVDCYQTAADYYEQENQLSRTNTCLLKLAQIHAQAERYDQAIELLEKVARASLDNSLLKWSVREYLFKAMLCHLCKADIVGAKRALDRYAELDVSFASQREYKLLSLVVSAYEAYDLDAFTSAVADYDSVTPLPPFLTTLLLRIKGHIKSESGNSVV
jgi:alpha-soluble NSF attachment protein